jgi:hypothetical protein
MVVSCASDHNIVPDIGTERSPPICILYNKKPVIGVGFCSSNDNDFSGLVDQIHLAGLMLPVVGTSLDIVSIHPKELKIEAICYMDRTPDSSKKLVT